MRNDHEGSIRTDGNELVSLADHPVAGRQGRRPLSAHRYAAVVGVMLGGAGDVGEMGPMQLSIASETVSQIATAMAEAWRGNSASSADGACVDVHDATLLPPPPFESYAA
jgi:hypothetical protein